MEKKSERKNNIIILVSVILFAIIVLLNVVGIFDTKLNVAYREEFNISEVKNIDLNIKYYDLSIKRTNADKIVVKYFGDNEENIDISNLDGQLSINMVDHEFIHRNSFLEQKVVLYLPKEFVGNLVIDSSTGDIVVNNYYNINLVIKNVEGDVYLNKINTAIVKSEEGDVVANKINVLIVDAYDADVIANNIKQELVINTLSGDVNVNKVKLSNTSSIKTSSGDIFVNNLKNAKTVIDQISGDLIIGKSYDGDYKFNIVTNSGDIQVH